MCIRDSDTAGLWSMYISIVRFSHGHNMKSIADMGLKPWICLLYTSDAADERSSVDLGGRRIIKKKKRKDHRGRLDY